MFRLITYLIVLVNSFSLCAQAPDNYYPALKTLSGDEMKAALHDIIKNQVDFPYTSSQTDTWDILKESDKDTSNTENVILLYSGWTVNGSQEYNNMNGWSREHVWAKSHGDFGTTKGAGTDVHNLKPADITVNSARGNKDFDWGGEIYVDGDGPTENRTDSDSWEPRDEIKGDVARILFYMSVRYEGEGDEPDLEIVDQVNTYDMNEPGKGFHGKLSTLIQWHKEDPVDSFEIRRNNIIYTYQNNRNPFIDNPEYVESIWDLQTGTDNLIDQLEYKVYPNPASSYFNIDLSPEKSIQVKLYTMNGYLVLNTGTTQSKRFSVEGVGPGIYILQIVTDNNSIRTKLFIK